ncbi:preprotein translocase subunit YajC [Geodermatophilus sp. SYSU D00815]
MEQYFPLILLALAAVLLFVLPARQRKRMMAQQQAMRESLAPGTPVMTTSGMHGTVVSKGDTTVDLEIAPGVVVTFVQQAILEVRKPAGEVPGSTVEPERPADDTGTDGPR